MTLKTLSKAAVLALVAGISVGCATTSDLEKVRAEAMAAANDAKATANAALQSANQANACCEQLQSGFKKSMYK